MHINKKIIKDYMEQGGIEITHIDLINPPCRGALFETHALINGKDRCVFIQTIDDLRTSFNTLLAFKTDFLIRSVIGKNQ